MNAPAGRRTIALTFPPGFIDLVSDGQVRASDLDGELTAAYPTLSRPAQERVLALLGTPEVADLLAAAAGHQVAVGLVQCDDMVTGIVVLAAAAARLPDWWSAEILGDELSLALSGRGDVEIEKLALRESAAVLVHHPAEEHCFEPPGGGAATYRVRRIDLYLAHPSCGSDVVVVSCTAVGATDSAVTELLSGIAGSVRAV